jgi:pimeloyl-ACP methyl ester carboxylesterase
MISRCLATALIIAATVFAGEPAELQTVTGRIFGTLELAQTKAPSPVVLIIAGSGPTDRDGNSRSLSGVNNSLKMLAEALQAHGISSVRYDKRGIAASKDAMVRESDLRFDTYVDDAAMWLNQLRQDKRFNRVYVAGHSEGSTIALVCAQKVNLDGLISIAGPGRPAFDVLEEQMQGRLPGTLNDDYHRIIAALKAGKTDDNVPSPLLSLFRPSVQPYLISWQKYDPAKLIAKIGAPVLILQGTTDIQVKMLDARLLSASAPHAHLVIVDGMNHVMKDVGDDRMAQLNSYGDPSLPVDSRLIEAVVSFAKTPNGRH